MARILGLDIGTSSIGGSLIELGKRKDDGSYESGELLWTHSHIFTPPVEDDYIALTQNPNYKKDPRWNDDNFRTAFVKEQDLKFLRPYQIKAIHALQESARTGNDRYLFEMATGTGKTLVASARFARTLATLLASGTPR